MEKNFMLQGATKLTNSQMKSVKGGVSVTEYCNTLQTMARGEYALEHWSPQEWDNWANAYETHCMK